MAETALARDAFAIEASDVSGQKRVRVAGISPTASVGDLVQRLVPRMGLTETDSSGRPIAYHLRSEKEGRHLNASEISGEVLSPGDQVVLQPNIMAG